MLLFEKLISGVPKGKSGLVGMLQPPPPLPLLRATLNLPKILSKNIPEHSVD